jgi:hypothetical protein
MGQEHPHNGSGGAKVCRICGKDLSRERRVRDLKGRYRCPTCVDDEVPGHAGGGGAPARRDPLGDTAAGRSAAGGTGLGRSGAFDPALAETRVDVEAVAETPAGSVPVFASGSGSDEPMRLAEGEQAGYTGAIGPRKRIDWGGADDAAEAVEESPAAAGVPPETAGSLDPSEIPEDRSGLLTRVRPGQLKLPGLLCVLGVLGAAGLAFGLRASPDQTERAAHAAFNSGMSALVQAAGAVGVYALACAIWVRPGVHWQVASARLGAYSALMAMVAIALTRIPVVGVTLMWLVPLIGMAIALRKLLRLSWTDSAYASLLIWSLQLGVRMALDADLWAA